MTAAPNFACALFAKRLGKQAQPGQFDLSTLRVRAMWWCLPLGPSIGLAAFLDPYRPISSGGWHEEVLAALGALPALPCGCFAAKNGISACAFAPRAHGRHSTHGRRRRVGAGRRAWLRCARGVCLLCSRRPCSPAAVRRSGSPRRAWCTTPTPAVHIDRVPRALAGCRVTGSIGGVGDALDNPLM